MRQPEPDSTPRSIPGAIAVFLVYLSFAPPIAVLLLFPGEFVESWRLTASARQWLAGVVEMFGYAYFFGWLQAAVLGAAAARTRTRNGASLCPGS
jgi:hypothetical protein